MVSLVRGEDEDCLGVRRPETVVENWSAIFAIERVTPASLYVDSMPVQAS